MLVGVVLENVVEAVGGVDVADLMVEVLLLDVSVELDTVDVEDTDVAVGSLPPPVGVVLGLIVAEPSDGVALQVLTWRPAVRDTRPSCCIGSDAASGTVPTYALKL